MCGYLRLTFQIPYTKPPKHLFLGKNYTQLGGEQREVAKMLTGELMKFPAPSFYGGPSTGETLLRAHWEQPQLYNDILFVF